MDLSLKNPLIYFHNIEQTLLTNWIAKKVMIGIGAIYVSPNNFLACRLLFQIVLEFLFRVSQIGTAQILPRYRPQIHGYALAYVFF